MIKARTRRRASRSWAPTSSRAARRSRSAQEYLRWQDRAANQKFFAGEHAAFSKEAADLLLEAGIIKQVPDMTQAGRHALHRSNGGAAAR